MSLFTLNTHLVSILHTIHSQVRAKHSVSYCLHNVIFPSRHHIKSCVSILLLLFFPVLFVPLALPSIFLCFCYFFACNIFACELRFGAEIPVFELTFLFFSYACFTSHMQTNNREKKGGDGAKKKMCTLLFTRLDRILSLCYQSHPNIRNRE